MAEVPKFKSREDIERWLKGRPKAVAVCLAARAALRAMPAVAENTKSFTGLALVSLRANLCSVVWGLGQTTEQDLSLVETAADSARSALSAADSALSAADSARSAARSAARSTADFAALSAVSMDAGRLLDLTAPSEVFTSAIWPDETKMEDSLRAVVTQQQATFLETLDADPDYRFWAAWYRGMTLGKPNRFPWEMLRDIVLIPDEIWNDKSDAETSEVVAVQIEKIMERYGFTFETVVQDDSRNMEETARFDPSTAPNVEQRIVRIEKTQVIPPLVLDEEFRVFRLGNEPKDAEEAVAFAKDRIRRVLRAVLKASNANGFREDSYEALTIRDVLDDDETSPSIVATAFYDAALSFMTTIGTTYPDDPGLLNFKNALYAASEEICEHSDIARQRCLKLAKLAPPRTPSKPEIQDIKDITDLVVEHMDDDARAVIEQDAGLLTTLLKAPKWVWARFINFATTVIVWTDKAMKFDKRREFIAKKLDKLWDWWNGPDDDDEEED